MPNAGPQLTATLALSIKEFEKGLKLGEKLAKNSANKLAGLRFKIPTGGIMVATKALKGFAATLASIGKGGLSGLGASFLMGGWQGLGGSIAAVGQKMTAGIVDAYEYARSLEILSRRTGFSTGALTAYKVAMEDTGVTEELFMRTTRMLNREMNFAMHGNQAATAGLEQIGLHVKEMMKLNPEQRFQALGNAIVSIKDEGMQAAAVVARFGSQSAKMLSFFKNPEALKNAGIAVGEQANIFQRSGKVMEQIAVRIGHIKVKVMGFFAGAAEAIMPMVDKFSAIFDKMDFSSWGKKMGMALNIGAAWLITFFNEPGKTTAYFWESMKAGALDFGNLLLNFAVTFGEKLGNEMTSAIRLKLAPFVGVMMGMDAAAAMVNAPAAMHRQRDFTGAGAAHARANAMRPNAAFEQAKGALGQNKTFVGDIPDVTTPWRLRGFHGTGGLMEKGSLGKFHSGLQGASMGGYLSERGHNLSPGMDGIGSLSHMHQGPYDRNNLLKHGELRRFRNMRVAMGLEQRRPGETANGDRARARAVAVELERKKQHAGSSEQLLSDIASYTDETQKIMKKAFD